ncbi:MAG: hypothetical protein JWP97_303 [Labilithrix sp.]|nr:hypothetical protein [Labilithrix sp.]
MSAKERIGMLQGLLERVTTRAKEPRGNGAVHAAAPAPALIAHRAEEEAPGLVARRAEEAPGLVARRAEQDETARAKLLDSVPPDTAHGQDMEAYAAAREAAHQDDLDADVEVSSETVEVDIDIDEPGYEPPGYEPPGYDAATTPAFAQPGAQSGAQPVAQPTMPPEDLEELEEEEPRVAHTTAAPSAPPEELVAAAQPANEIEEEAPSSSRRPIAGEEPHDAYAAESAPRHTPPPESGKQATAPSVHPAARSGSEPTFEREEAGASLNPSAPPPSLEGHTLIGGWREPGLGQPRVPQVGAGLTTGVRVPAPPPAAGAPPAQASGTRLSPDVTRPEVAASAAGVASFEGDVAIARPSTMGELLDLTLSL